MLVRHIRLYIPSVRRDGNKPVLSIVFQKLHIWKHGYRVLGAKSDHIYHRRIEPVPVYLIRIVWITSADKSLLQSVRKPLGIEGGDIRSLSCVDDHIEMLPFSSFLYIISKKLSACSLELIR